MSYRIEDDLSLESMMDYVDSATAALMAQSETEKLAEAWDAFYQKLAQAHDARRGDQRAVLRTTARVRLHDTRWDAAVVALSGEAYHHSGKDSKKKPYALLFKIPAARALKFGGNRATTYGNELLHQAAALDHPGLHAALSDFEQANQALKDAIAARTEATRALRTHNVRRAELVDELQELTDRTEVEILKLYPGNDDLVRAILSPEGTRRSRVEAAQPPDPTPPAAPEG